VDCERLDALAMELVYDELDARAAEEARLHLLGCPRCAGMIERLRGGLRAAEALPIESPSSLLESRILEAATAARPKVPWHRRAARAMAVAGTWAMRPQIAMAAVVVLMIGTSAVLLRRTSPDAAQRRKVTDEGTPVATLDTGEGAPGVLGARPSGAAKLDEGGAETKKAKEKRRGDGEADKDRAEQPNEVAAADDGKNAAPGAGSKGENAGGEKLELAPAAPRSAASASAAIASPATAATYDDAMTAYGASRWDAALRGFDAAAAGGIKPSSALLYAGRSLRALGKCTDALTRFRKVVETYPGTPDAANAALEGGECARSNGDSVTARAMFEKAKESATTRARAEAALAAMDTPKAKVGGPSATATTIPPAKPMASPTSQ
jgi:TolA-binding protein